MQNSGIKKQNKIGIQISELDNNESFIAKTTLSFTPLGAK